MPRDLPPAASGADPIQSGALAIVRVKREHRARLARFTTLAERLYRELFAMSQARRDVLEAICSANWDPDKWGKDVTQAVYRRIVAMPERIKSLRELAETIKTLTTLERQAWELDAPLDDVPKVAPDRTKTPAEHYKWLAGIRQGQAAA